MTKERSYPAVPDPVPAPPVETLRTHRCKNFCPPEWTGRWRDWHRGHGCHLDPDLKPPPAETLSRGVRNGRRWLTRQQVPDGREPELDEGDCRICGGAAGEGHEPSDVCGIIADLLCEIEGLRAGRALRAAPPPAPPAVPPQDASNLAQDYMADRMAMPNVLSDQEQNWIFGHMVTFALSLYPERAALASSSSTGAE